MTLQTNRAKLQYQCFLSCARHKQIFWTPGDELDQRLHLILVQTSFLALGKVVSDTLASTHIYSTSLCTFVLRVAL